MCRYLLHVGTLLLVHFDPRYYSGPSYVLINRLFWVSMHQEYRFRYPYWLTYIHYRLEEITPLVTGVKSYV